MSGTGLRILEISMLCLGGGGGTLIIAILKRKSEIRAADASADSVQADATTKMAEVSNKLTHRLAEEIERQTARALALEDRMDEIRAVADRGRAETARLQSENDRLGRQIGALRADLDVSRTVNARQGDEILDLRADLDASRTELEAARAQMASLQARLEVALRAQA